jgi:hypothetical protein
MKLSFFPDGCEDCPLLMLSDLTGEELGTLQQIAGDLASGRRDSASLGQTSECTLVARAADRDVGIGVTPPRFECSLRRITWWNIEGLIEPFLTDRTGYQWWDRSGDVALLLSPGGEW